MSHLEELLELPVQTNMRLDPPTVSKSEPVAHVVTLMVREDIGAVIVVEEDRPVGIITERDVLDKVMRPGKTMDRTLAGAVMSEPLFSIEIDRPMREALKIMAEKDIRRLAVTENGALVGLVSERRLLEVAFLVTETDS